MPIQAFTVAWMALSNMVFCPASFCRASARHVSGSGQPCRCQACHTEGHSALTGLRCRCNACLGSRTLALVAQLLQHALLWLQSSGRSSVVLVSMARPHTVTEATSW